MEVGCSGFRVWGLEFKLWGAGFRVQGLGSEVWGSGLTSPPAASEARCTSAHLFCVCRDWYVIAEQPAPAPHLAHPERCAALRIVLVTVPRFSTFRMHVQNVPRREGFLLVSTRNKRTFSSRFTKADRPGVDVPPRKALRGGIQKSILTDLSGNVGISRQMMTKTRKWLQERGRDTPTKGFLWHRLVHRNKRQDSQGHILE